MSICKYLAIASGSVLMSPPVMAQQSHAPGSNDADIVVTAQKRTERLQDVPLSIGAIKGDLLEEYGASGFDTFANRIPGLQITKAASSNTQLAIRGISTSIDRGDRAQLNNTVGLYLDEVEIGVTAANPDLNLYDLERVEVLRGPQGTLFGAGAMAGAIRLITRKPVLDVVEAAANAEISTTRRGEENIIGDAVINVPLVKEMAAIRVLGFYRREGGYVDNVLLGVADANDRDSYGGRIALTIMPAPDLTISAKAALQNTNVDETDTYNGNLPFLQKRTEVLEYSKDKSRVYDVTAIYDADSVIFSSITTFQRKYQFVLPEVGRFPVFFGASPGQFSGITLPTTTRVRGFSQEMRASSAQSSMLKWIVGGFYSNTRRRATQTLDVPGIEAAELVPPGSIFDVWQDRLYDGDFRVRTRQTALFADITAPLGSSLSASAGLRWYRYNQSINVDYKGIFADGGLALRSSGKKSGFNPRFNLSYRLDPEKLLYTQIARGFRIGGQNEPVPVNVCATDLAALGETGQPGAFGPDSLWNYELGAKTSFAGGALSVNVAAFHIDYSDVQFQRSLACGYTIIQNAGKMSSKGLELEVAARPADRLRLGFGLAYTDSQLENDVTNIGRKGDPAPFVPEWSVNGSIDYRAPLSGDWTMTLSADASYVDSRVTAFSLNAPLGMPSYSVGNIRIGAETPSFKVMLFVDNLWDEEAILFRNNYVFSASPNLRTAVLRPRTIGLRAGIQM